MIIITQEEILKLAIQNGIVDIDTISKEIIMKRKNELLSLHPYEVTQLPDGRWQTYLPDEKKGRILKRRKTLTAINNVIIDYWETHEQKDKKIDNITFQEAYSIYISFQYEKVNVSPNTYKKYLADYKRFFKDTELDQSLINSIDSEDIRAFIISTTKQKNLRIKALKELISLLKGTFKHMFSKKYIKNNPMIEIETKEFSKYCIKPVVKNEDRILVNDEPIKLYEEINRRIKKNKFYMGNYAILMSLYTGMRVGEIAALSWNDIYTDYIIIRNEEVYNPLTKENTIQDFTKNRSERVLPITPQIMELLETIKTVQKFYNYTPYYLFSKRDGSKMSARQISNIMNHRTKQAGFIKSKSIHSVRRTINSTLIQNGVPITTRTSLMGHTSEVNENNYSYDLATIKTQKELLSKGTIYEKSIQKHSRS